MLKKLSFFALFMLLASSCSGKIDKQIEIPDQTSHIIPNIQIPDNPYELFVANERIGIGSTNVYNPSVSQQTSTLFLLDKKTGDTWIYSPLAGGWVYIPTTQAQIIPKNVNP